MILSKEELLKVQKRDVKEDCNSDHNNHRDHKNQKEPHMLQALKDIGKFSQKILDNATMTQQNQTMHKSSKSLSV